MRAGKLVALLAASLMSLGAAPEQAGADIRLNQVGLLQDAQKQAVLAHASSTPLEWRLKDATGKLVATGRTKVFGPDRFSAEHVHRIELPQSIAAGDGYRLSVGDQSSRPFPVISSGAYGRLAHDALAFFYHQRAGTAIDGKLVGERWARPAGHPSEVVRCISGADRNGNRWPGCDYAIDAAGGWYDAGDHGKYIVNGGISLWTLLNIYELQIQRAGKLFADGSARIPEAGNGIPDILDEARWEIEFFFKMQAPDGSRQRLPVGEKRSRAGLTFKDVDTSGMAHHKVADEKWTALPMRPDRDPERRVLFPPSTGATLNLAATAAQCARIWREIDAAFSARCLAAARRAWAAAVRNPDVYPIAEFTGSGGYGDRDFSDEFYWAASELLVTTGDAEFRRAIETSSHFRAPIAGAQGWASVAPLGTIVLASNPERMGAAEANRLRTEVARAADRFLTDRQRTGYGVPMAAHWTWGSTSNLLNRAMLFALAHDWTGDPKYRAGVVDVMDFILGRNPLDRSFVSGYGARPMQHPHHRFWAHSLDPAFPPPPPGALSGGPNNESMADEVAAKMKGRCAAQTCWADDIHAYSLNEVAINWNAPLVWVSAWLADSSADKAAN